MILCWAYKSDNFNRVNFITADNITSVGEITILGALTKKFQNADYDENLIAKIYRFTPMIMRMIKALSSNKSKFIMIKCPYFNIGFFYLVFQPPKSLTLIETLGITSSLLPTTLYTNIPYWFIF